MPELAQVQQLIAYADELYHRLVLIVGPSGSGKTALLRHLHAAVAAPCINVNLALSQQLLDLPARDRILRGPSLLCTLVDATAAPLVLLDNTELLFHHDYRWKPLDLLKSCARDRTVVAAWNGRLADGYVIYATPDHPDYRREPIREILTYALT
ncbi:MAG: BREX-3 system P-loop-containing protein BrxF [Planctomycetales bacterium]|nr:BREX-3 system P-loop-containing protein BrxF [Planctomycetales bacterium]